MSSSQVGTISMIVKLIVVKGKPEGRVIPLAGPVFKIGRNETCQLRPNSEQVSREHSQFTLQDGVVTVQDLGSRNGTFVNGKQLTEPCQIKDRDLVQVGPLTFAVSIEGADVATVQPVASGVGVASLDEVGHAEIESWLVADSVSPTPDRPSGVYHGETVTVATYQADIEDGTGELPSATTETVSAEYEQFTGPEDVNEEEGNEASDQENITFDMPEEFIDESNPFYAKPAVAAKPEFKDSSEAASDILRKMTERRKASKSS
jgi:pSer/pThr/pTyr-binding forkhead associated (FHA) protein